MLSRAKNAIDGHQSLRKNHYRYLTC